MKWSTEQEAALSAISNWFNNDSKQIFRLFGYAGTGKTTLAKHIAEGITGQVLFAAFTGKAAHVLKTKGCENATTIHGLIYTPKEKGQAKLKDLELQLFKLRTELKAINPNTNLDTHPRVQDLNKMIAAEKAIVVRPSFTLNTDSVVKTAKLVIIDECSMVDETIGKDLLSFGTKILVLGDPAQLPPIYGAGYFTEVQPDFMLTEIHRQAADNPIIAMATKVRQGLVLPLGLYGDSKVISRSELKPSMVLEADQILVGRNNTRYTYNKRLRELLGRKNEFPEVRDKLVCLRNHNELGLLNGAIWFIDEILATDSDLTTFVINDGNGTKIETTAHSHYFLGKGDKLQWWEKKEAEEFDYGYALTCHKSQGSQWNNIVLFDESDCFRKDKNRWLYTAITRAAEKITIIKEV